MDTIKIGLADDHQLFLKGIKSLITGLEGLEVYIEASSGDELLRKMETNPIDLVLLDMQMPGLDGLQTMEQIQNKWPAVKIIFLTMHKEERLILSCMEAGAHGFLQKDAHPDEMEKAIRNVIENGYYFDQRISKIMVMGLTKKRKITKEPEISFTEREIDILRLICKEKTTQEIADELFLSPRTIDGYRERLMEKTEARNMAGLVVYAAKRGWLEEWLSTVE